MSEKYPMQEPVDLSLLSTNLAGYPNVLYLKELTETFKNALSNQNTKYIKSMWQDNPSLRSYYSGMSILVSAVNQHGQTELQTVQISAAELIADFKLVLSSRCSEIIKHLWAHNTCLASYYSGKTIQVSVANPIGLQTVQITITELIADFKEALSSRCSEIINYLWDNNPGLASYYIYSGETIQVSVANPIGLQTVPITITELSADFNEPLSSRYSEIIDYLWDDNPDLASYYSYSGENIQVSVANPIELQTVPITITELSADFKEALSSRCYEIINYLWDYNPGLASYYSGKSTLVLDSKEGGEIEQQWLQIPLSDAIVNLKRVLSSQCPEIIKKMWKKNPTLAKYYCGMAITALVTNHDGQIEQKTVQISIAELAANFRGALSSHCSEISGHMWTNSPGLASYFSGKETVVLSTNEKTGQIEQKTVQIQFIELIDNFKSAMSGKNSIVINAMCENNLSLVSYYSGKSTSVLVANGHGDLVQQTVQIATTDLIANFKTVLPCCCSSFLESIWMDDETPLRLEVNKLPEDELKTLTKSVLSLSGRGCNLFITAFLHSISNRALLESMLSDLSSESEKRYVTSQINYLKARITLLTAPQKSSTPLPPVKERRQYELFDHPDPSKRRKFHNESNMDIPRPGP